MAVQHSAGADLVVAAIEGAGQQTWYQLARALAAAARVVATNGSIVVCSDLESALGPGLQCLAAAESPEDARREIIRHRPHDALVASELIHALENSRVYLLSRLEESDVEALGVAPVSSPDDVSRLAARHESCILLGNAQQTLVQIQDE